QHLQARGGLVKEAMAEYPVLLEEHQSARDVLSQMLMHGIQTLSVIDSSGNLVGIVSYRDLQHALKDTYAEENQP
ncbi:MAG: CBS domain-containing protein, partial [Syntrophobacterales bacterium]